MNAELRHIEAFLAVARLGSFTRAAGTLNVSQPALTVQIRQFEQALGVRLFDRNNRRVSLTQAGRDLVAPLERISLDVHAVLTHAHDLSAHRRGTVTIAALPSVAAGVLPRAIRTLADQHQGLTVRVRDVTAERVLDLVKGGDVDFGIGSLIRPDPDILAEPIYTDRLAAFVPDGHPLSGRRHIRLRELASYPLILTGRDSSVRQLVDRAIESLRIPVHVAQEAAYMSTAVGMVKAGLGVAILPRSALGSDAPGELRAIAIRSPILMRQISTLRRSGHSLSPAAERFAEILRRMIAAPNRSRRRSTS